jgi:hypothetical protein
VGSAYIYLYVPSKKSLNSKDDPLLAEIKELLDRFERVPVLALFSSPSYENVNDSGKDYRRIRSGCVPS